MPMDISMLAVANRVPANNVNPFTPLIVSIGSIYTFISIHIVTLFIHGLPSNDSFKCSLIKYYLTVV